MPPCTNEWGNILWESVVKYTEIDKEKKPNIPCFILNVLYCLFISQNNHQ